jgi:hypothetical protein
MTTRELYEARQKAGGNPVAHPKGHSRKVAISVFANEKSTTPVKSGAVSWPYVVGLHKHRFIRDSKSGQ